MPSKSKILTSAIALGAAAALTLGGTFAWQSINQTALNEASDIVNPGGRLHVDMNYNGAMNTNSDVYVENFTKADNGGQDIYARIRLEEYMEIVMNYDDPDLETVEVVAGSKTPVDGSTLTADQATRQDEFEYTYAIHYFGLSDTEMEEGTENNAAYTYWKLNPGTEKSHENLYFMPTFNLNKDSLVADINGTYYDTLGGISNRGVSQYDYTVWEDGDKRTATEIYDGDVDTNDELQKPAAVNDIIENGEDSTYYTGHENDIVLVPGEEHTAKQVGETRGFISMAEWKTLFEDGGDIDNYWVYDTDGWVYWSSPIAPGECTGLLLDSFDLLEIMDDTWYYAINVVGQFVTADDSGWDDNTGFFADGETVSDDAKFLLDSIGLVVGEQDTETDNTITQVDFYHGGKKVEDGSTSFKIGVEDKLTMVFRNKDGKRIADKAAIAELMGSESTSFTLDDVYDPIAHEDTTPTVSGTTVSMKIDQDRIYNMTLNYQLGTELTGSITLVPDLTAVYGDAALLIADTSGHVSSNAEIATATAALNEAGYLYCDGGYGTAYMVWNADDYVGGLFKSGNASVRYYETDPGKLLNSDDMRYNYKAVTIDENGIGTIEGGTEVCRVEYTAERCQKIQFTKAGWVRVDITAGADRNGMFAVLVAVGQ